MVWWVIYTTLVYCYVVFDRYINSSLVKEQKVADRVKSYS